MIYENRHRCGVPTNNYLKISPITNVNPAFPPTHVQHGEFDKRPHSEMHMNYTAVCRKEKCLHARSFTKDPHMALTNQRKNWRPYGITGTGLTKMYSEKKKQSFSAE
ncbi:hypothetical protein A4R26_01780 [Niastella populi]|uniref:Uncharacterized protein n=1 Tax=Niastella populi TaxID=550983 RepID=A0A1V9GDD2_9BACT|nr:hypothetical protein A4R26_01780 [Niastella populi]